MLLTASSTVKFLPAETDSMERALEIMDSARRRESSVLASLHTLRVGLKRRYTVTNDFQSVT